MPCLMPTVLVQTWDCTMKTLFPHQPPYKINCCNLFFFLCIYGVLWGFFTVLSYRKVTGGRIVLSSCREPREGSYFCKDMLSGSFSPNLEPLLVSMSGPSKQNLPHVRVWNLLQQYHFKILKESIPTTLVAILLSSFHSIQTCQ